MAMQKASIQDLVDEVERRRVLQRIAQRRLATDLQITQGHYSKIIRGKIPVGKRAVAAMSAWLEVQSGPPRDAKRSLSIVELAGEISMQCIKLARLMGEIEG